MIVTATEFKTNFGKYLDMVTKEISSLPAMANHRQGSHPQVSAVDSLRGMLKKCPFRP